MSSDTNELNDQHEKQLRYHAYKAVCKKYQQEIAAIQKYFPNWQPRFDQLGQ
jgi:hypothetical protein